MSTSIQSSSCCHASQNCDVVRFTRSLRPKSTHSLCIWKVHPSQLHSSSWGEIHQSMQERQILVCDVVGLKPFISNTLWRRKPGQWISNATHRRAVLTEIRKSDLQHGDTTSTSTKSTDSQTALTWLQRVRLLKDGKSPSSRRSVKTSDDD